MSASYRLYNCNMEIMKISLQGGNMPFVTLYRIINLTSLVFPSNRFNLSLNNVWYVSLVEFFS